MRAYHYRGSQSWSTGSGCVSEPLAVHRKNPYLLPLQCVAKVVQRLRLFCDARPELRHFRIQMPLVRSLKKHLSDTGGVLLCSEIGANMLATTQTLTPAQEARRVRKGARHPHDDRWHPLCRHHDHKGCKRPATVKGRAVAWQVVEREDTRWK
jgi:hypothetical protein